MKIQKNTKIQKIWVSAWYFFFIYQEQTLYIPLIYFATVVKEDGFIYVYVDNTWKKHVINSIDKVAFAGITTFQGAISIQTTPFCTMQILIFYFF